MKRLVQLSIISIFILISCSNNSDTSIIGLKTKSLKMSINNAGLITELSDINSNVNYISQDTASVLMAIRMNNIFKSPESAQIKDGTIILKYDQNIEATVKFEEKEDYITFELVSLTNKEDVDLILWGPYFNIIHKIIGETVGVVRDETFSLGIQSLNIKTLGGYPWNESDRMPEFDIFTEDDPNNMHPNADGSVLYRVEAAKPTKNGSSLQAYTRNRNKERVIQDFDHEKIIAPAYNDGGVIGSKIALFGSSSSKALGIIGAIELAEELPHPIIDGVWGKTAPGASAAYIITSFTEDNVQDAITLTKKAGLKYLYHYGKTFENWGHFDLYKGEFPNGIEGLNACVEKAKAQGVYLGTHFLSNFITTNDAYVSPVPDSRLAKVGSSKILENIDATVTEIEIASPDFFNQYKNNNLKTVMIGEELIRYNKVSEQEPWKLLDCQRGAFNTIAKEHKSGEEISKLLDHGYKVFLTNAELTIEMSKTMAELYNKTGLRQISFDGLEGNRSTGLGTYGESLMPYTWYNNLSEDSKKHLIIDASRTTHFFWHIYSRMNWGEPWYGGFRESQTEYRFKNQAYFKRNFMPGMLGWFKMTEETSIEDIEWLLSRSAGYDAGYAFVTSNEVIAKNGNSDKILNLIGDWEKLRISNSFSEEQKELMRMTGNEFELIKSEDESWNLNHINTTSFKHEKKIKQPGEPLNSVFEVNNNGKDQTLNFIFSANNCKAKDIKIEINNYKSIALSITLNQGEHLKYIGGNHAIIYDADWQPINEIPINSLDFKINSGLNNILFDCKFETSEKDSNVKLEFRTISKEEKIELKK